MNLDRQLMILARFLARRDIELFESDWTLEPIDLIVLLGSSLLASADVAAKAFLSGVGHQLLIAGGVGHSTDFLRAAVRRFSDLDGIEVDGRGEADILADVLALRHGICREGLLIESQSTNCGSNAWEVKSLLQRQGLEPSSILLIQDPTMQRRSHASFERAWRGERSPRFISFAPFVPIVKSGLVEPPGQWDFERFVSLVLGEIPRLMDTADGYGPLGKDFIEHVDIPGDVIAAHSEVALWFGATNRT